MMVGGAGGRGFTLLEAVIALAILSAVMMAALGVRAQAIAARSELARGLASERDADTIFQMVLAGAIDAPEVDAESGTVVWRGAYLGEAYEVRRSPFVAPNPSREAVSYTVAPVIVVYRYEIDYRGRTTAFTWHH